MPCTVDFDTVSTVGLESSPVAAALAGLRANEARFLKNKCKATAVLLAYMSGPAIDIAVAKAQRAEGRATSA